MSLKLGETLEKMGYTVAFCRIEDVDDGLMSRAAKANAGEFDMFICIHRNSYNNSANGVETLYKTGEALDKAFAQALQDKFVALNIFNNRGLKPRDNLVVTNNARDDLPTALVELGFIDTEKDNNAFDTYFNQIALAMAEACTAYQGKSFGTEATLTVDGKNYTYTGTQLNISASSPDISFKIGNGYGISGVSCKDSLGTYALSYADAGMTSHTASVGGSFSLRADATVNGVVIATLKFADGFGVEKTVAVISCEIVFADPFTFKEEANLTGISLNIQTGYITFGQGAMNATEIIALFADSNMKVTGTNGSVLTDVASTGCVLSTTVNGTTSTVTIVVYGDVDGDGATTTADFLGVSAHIKNRAELTGANEVAADLSGDNAVSTVDLITMAQSLKN